MKILVVAPWPPGRVRPRSFGLIRTLLSQGHRIHLVYAAWGSRERAEFTPDEKLSTERIQLQPLGGLIRAAASVPKKVSLQAAFVNSPKLRRAISAAVQSFDPDLLYFNVLRTAHLKPVDAPQPSVIDLDEIRSRYYHQLSHSSSNLIWRFIARSEARRMERMERHIRSAFDSILVSSHSDVAVAGTRAALVRTPVPFQEPAAADTTDRERDGLVFAGRLSYRANAEGIRWFAKRVMPIIRSHGRNIPLTVVGRGASRAIHRLSADDVFVRGAVVSVDTYLRAAAVSVIPIFMATGVQMKLIESLRAGTPVVCTPRVAELAGITPGVHCLTATSPHEWADAIVLLLDNPSLRASLARDGREWIEENYREDVIASQLSEAVRGSLGGRDRV